MFSTLHPDRTTVARLRVRGRARAAAGRAVAALAGADLRPAALDPAAILCVRRLVDPLPGRVSTRSQIRPPVEWEGAVAGSLAALYRAAWRPARGAVPADAEAVLFADQAELVACLAIDWREGILPSRWWWRGLLPATDVGQLIARMWAEQPEHVPATLACLAASGRAARVVSALSHGDAVAIVKAIVTRFGLSY
jgi:hypothetical protein